MEMNVSIQANGPSGTLLGMAQSALINHILECDVDTIADTSEMVNMSALGIQTSPTMDASITPKVNSLFVV